MGAVSDEEANGIERARQRDTTLEPGGARCIEWARSLPRASRVRLKARREPKQRKTRLFIMTRASLSVFMTDGALLAERAAEDRDVSRA